MDLSGKAAQLHMRTDANNLVTTALTTHLPEQKETIHMIQMLRKESCSGSIEDLAHVRTEHCLADSLTQHSAKPDTLIKAVNTGELPHCDTHQSFRSLLKHRAYLARWIVRELPRPQGIAYFAGEAAQLEILQSLRKPTPSFYIGE